MEKQKLYVNEFFEVENIPEKQKAIVNRVAGMLEIAFLEPVAEDCKIDRVDVVCRWCQKNLADYENFRRCTLPHAETCLLANAGLSAPKFSNCLTSSQQTDRDGRVHGWDALDEKGRLADIDLNTKGNVYAAVIVTEEYFLKINPDVDFQNYKFSEHFVAL